MPTTTTTTEEPRSKGDIYINDTLITPFGRTFRESDIEIGRDERTASGKLVRDIVTTKKNFELSYSYIDGDELAVLEAFYALNAALTLDVWYDDTDNTEYTVLMKPIDKTRVLLLGDGLWGNVKIELEEV